MPSAIRRIHSKYLGDKAFPKGITEFEIREFFDLSATRTIRVDSDNEIAPCARLTPQCDVEPFTAVEFSGQQKNTGASAAERGRPSLFKTIDEDRRERHDHINRSGRSTYPGRIAVLTSGATPYLDEALPDLPKQ